MELVIFFHYLFLFFFQTFHIHSFESVLFHLIYSLLIIQLMILLLSDNSWKIKGARGFYALYQTIPKRNIKSL